MKKTYNFHNRSTFNYLYMTAPILIYSKGDMYVAFWKILHCLLYCFYNALINNYTCKLGESDVAIMKFSGMMIVFTIY